MSRWRLGAVLALVLGGALAAWASAPGPPPLASPGNPALVATGDTFPSPASRQEIFTIGIDGRGRRAVTRDGRHKFLPHFSPDGQRLLYTRFARGGYGDWWAATDVFVLDRPRGVRRS